MVSMDKKPTPARDILKTQPATKQAIIGRHIVEKKELETETLAELLKINLKDKTVEELIEIQTQVDNLFILDLEPEQLSALSAMLGEIDILIEKRKEEKTEPISGAPTIPFGFEFDPSDEDLEPTTETPPIPEITPAVEEVEVKTFSLNFIEERIKSLLKSMPNIKEIKTLNVLEGGEGEISIFLEVRARKIRTIKNIAVSINLENSGNGISVKDYIVKASSLQKQVEELIVPKIEQIPKLVKSYIEKEKGEIVEKVEIKDGKLRVTFGALTETPPIPEITPAVEEVEVKEKKAEAIRALKETIATTMEELADIDKRLAEIRKEKSKGPETKEARVNATESSPVLLEEKSSLLELTELELRQLRETLEKTSRVRFLKREKLEAQIFELEAEVGGLEEEIQKLKSIEEKRIESIEEKRIDREENPFKYYLVDKMHERNRQVLFGDDPSAEEITRLMGKSGRDLENEKIWNPHLITSERDYAVHFSVNGFYLKLTNREEVQEENGIKVDDSKARYDLIAPDSTVLYSDLDYKEGCNLLNERTEEYQQEMLEEFNNEINLRELESLSTIEEKREFLEQKKREEIEKLEIIKETLDLFRQLSEENPEDEYYKQQLIEIENNPIQYCKEEIAEKQKSQEEWKDGSDEEITEYTSSRQDMIEYYQRKIEKLQETIKQIQAINVKYDALLAKLGDN